MSYFLILFLKYLDFVLHHQNISRMLVSAILGLNMANIKNRAGHYQYQHPLQCVPYYKEFARQEISAQ
jgi:hypothetical protein